MSLEDAGLKPNLSAIPRRVRPIDPESQVPDGSVGYEKLRLTDRLRAADLDPNFPITWSNIALQGGWVNLPSSITLTYSSADAPTFVATTSQNISNIIPVGSKLALVQSSTQKYFLVTAVGASTITLYGGTDYTLTNATVSDVYYSFFSRAVGFPQTQAKWTVETKNTVNASQGSPTNGQWYNLGATRIDIPIGAWRVQFKTRVYVDKGANTDTLYNFATLSTSSSSASDADFTVGGYHAENDNMDEIMDTFFVEKPLVLTAKTTYYLNAMTTFSTSSPSVLSFDVTSGSSVNTIIRAISAYL